MLASSAPTVPVAVKVRVTTCSATFPSPIAASSKTARLSVNTSACSGSEAATILITELYFASKDRVTESIVTTQKLGVIPVIVDDG